MHKTVKYTDIYIAQVRKSRVTTKDKRGSDKLQTAMVKVVMARKA